MYEVKAIETEYNGYLFRSRTEARWAVFFDYIGEPYEYEKECFQLPSGKYLPDFFLPKKNLWVEIKGKEPTEKEWKKCVELYKATETNVLCLWGTPGKEEGKILTHEENFFEVTRLVLIYGVLKFAVVKRYMNDGFDTTHHMYVVEGFLHLNKEYKHFFEWCEYRGYQSGDDEELYREAVAYSRQARFERGVNNPRSKA